MKPTNYTLIETQASVTFSATERALIDELQANTFGMSRDSEFFQLLILLATKVSANATALAKVTLAD